jgi:hypothetical protein
MTATQIRMWIYGLALAALVAVGLSVSGSPYASTGAVALIVIAALLAVRAIAGSAVFRFGRKPQVAPAYARRPVAVSRQIAPDAPGRARPRAPGCSNSL